MTSLLVGLGMGFVVRAARRRVGDRMLRCADAAAGGLMGFGGVLGYRALS